MSYNMVEFEVPKHKRTGRLSVSPILPFTDLKEEYKFSSNLALQIEAFKSRYVAIRRIRGDGNCFFRAFIFEYLERLIILGAEQIKAFSILLRNDSSFFEFKKEEEKYIEKIERYLNQIIRERNERGQIQALQLFFHMFNWDLDFDIGLIIIMRRIIANFFELDSDVKIEGIPLNEAIPCETEEEFIKIILKQGEDACQAIFSITPLVFRIKLKILMLDPSNDTVIEEVCYKSRCESINHILKDNLDLHDEEITVLFIPGHYQVLYEKESAEKVPNCLLYDKDIKHMYKLSDDDPAIIEDFEIPSSPPNLNEEEKESLIPNSTILCEFCKKPVLDDIFQHCDQFKAHISCFLYYIDTKTDHKFILTKNERKAINLKCKFCDDDFTKDDIKNILSDQDKNKYQEEMEKRKKSYREKNLQVFLRKCQIYDNHEILQVIWGSSLQVIYEKGVVYLFQTKEKKYTIEDSKKLFGSELIVEYMNYFCCSCCKYLNNPYSRKCQHYSCHPCQKKDHCLFCEDMEKNKPKSIKIDIPQQPQEKLEKNDESWGLCGCCSLLQNFNKVNKSYFSLKDIIDILYQVLLKSN